MSLTRADQITDAVWEAIVDVMENGKLHSDDLFVKEIIHHVVEQQLELIVQGLMKEI